METIRVLEGTWEELVQLDGLVRVREWLDNLMDDAVSVLEAVAIHDNRWDA